MRNLRRGNPVSQHEAAIEKFRQACEEAYDCDLNREDMAKVVTEVNEQRDGEYAD